MPEQAGKNKCVHTPTEGEQSRSFPEGIRTLTANPEVADWNNTIHNSATCGISMAKYMITYEMSYID